MEGTPNNFDPAAEMLAQYKAKQIEEEAAKKREEEVLKGYGIGPSGERIVEYGPSGEALPQKKIEWKPDEYGPSGEKTGN